MAKGINWNVRLKPRDKKFLSGPGTKWQEFKYASSVLMEFIKGFRALHRIGPCITVFGSARFTEEHPYYKDAYQVGKKISELGLTVMTGGGPGIMEAANRGAFENGGRSVGCNIYLPTEQLANKFMHKWVEIKYFFVRKALLIKYSYGFIIMPGGVGTMDEFFETLTLIQTRTLQHFPVVMIGKAYYQDIWEMLQKMLLQKTISAEDMDLVLFTDDINEAMDHIKFYIEKNYELDKMKPLEQLIDKFF
ncbi:MAG: TIGR00730 family Rossman fold protein [Chitinophagales bacterium]